MSIFDKVNRLAKVVAALTDRPTTIDTRPAPDQASDTPLVLGSDMYARDEAAWDEDMDMGEYAPTTPEPVDPEALAAYLTGVVDTLVPTARWAHDPTEDSPAHGILLRLDLPNTRPLWRVYPYETIDPREWGTVAVEDALRHWVMAKT